MNIVDKILNRIKSDYVNYKVFPKDIAKIKPIYISHCEMQRLKKGMH